jgi:hypothetical protein
VCILIVFLFVFVCLGIVTGGVSPPRIGSFQFPSRSFDIRSLDDVHIVSSYAQKRLSYIRWPRAKQDTRGSEERPIDDLMDSHI